MTFVAIIPPISSLLLDSVDKKITQKNLSCGRCRDRTCDLCRVKTALYH